MLKTIILAAVATALLAQIGGCHYYVNAVPQIIISSEPIQVQNQVLPRP